MAVKVVITRIKTQMLNTRVIVCSFFIIVGGSACSKAPTPYAWNLPYDIPAPTVPADNPITVESVKLGETLFFDTALSADNTISCSSCHHPENAFAEPKPVSVGARGDKLNRNALALVNVAYNASFTWAHNNLDSIEKQLLIPLFNEHPVEMGVTGNEGVILTRLEQGDYPALFKAAYGDETPNVNNIVKALASYVRSLVSFNSAFDAYAYGQDDGALTPQQLEGLNLFFSERTECFHCHGGVNFTQSSKHSFQAFGVQPFHNTGLYNEDGAGSYPVSDMGLYSVTLNKQDMGKFRAPTLRNIALTAPYMHDGSIATLSDVIEFYARGGNKAETPNPYRSPFIKGFTLSEEEKAALVAFLQSLTDEEFIEKHVSHKN